MGKSIDKYSNWILLLTLSNRLQLGRRFWLIPLVVLVWPLFQALRLLVGWRQQNFAEVDVQNLLIGFPLYILAIGIGVRIIANEIEQRTLEVTFTLPGGARRAWLSKLIAASFLILCTEALLALCTLIFFTSYSVTILYGVFQGAAFYLVLAMGAGALLKSELMAAMVTGVLFIINTTMTSSRWSPLFNPLNSTEVGANELLAWSIQNHIGTALVIAGIAALSFFRTERREELLGN